MDVRTKKECYALYEKGFFGNKALTWNSFEEILKSKWAGKVCIRGKKPIHRGKVRYNLTLEEAKQEIQKLGSEGIGREDLTFNQSMPDNHLTIQGEVMRGEKGLELLYTDVQEPMNLALKKKAINLSGLSALNLLRANLYPSSYSEIMELLDLFPDSVVEFSAYRLPVGNIPGRNAVIWEVRNY